MQAIATEIIDSNLYMALGTADASGRPWVSPVYYAADRYRDLYWISSPEVRHSRNIATRPDVSIVVFDSRVAPGTGQAVYMSAVAKRLSGADVERGLEVYPGPPERGARPIALDDVTAPSPYRLYRARVSEHSILCPRTGPCAAHGHAFDHRTAVSL